MMHNVTCMLPMSHYASCIFVQPSRKSTPAPEELSLLWVPYLNLWEDACSLPLSAAECQRHVQVGLIFASRVVSPEGGQIAALIITALVASLHRIGGAGRDRADDAATRGGPRSISLPHPVVIVLA